MKEPKKLSIKLLSQKGFSHVELFVAILVITAIAFIGDRVMHYGHAQSSCTVNAILVNSCHPLLGSFSQGYNLGSGFANTGPSITQTQAAEKRAGRNFDVIHTTYHAGVGGDKLTSEEVYFATKTNQTVFLNWWPTKDWAQGDTSSINGVVDAMANSIKSQVQNVAPNAKIFMTLQHEPNNKVSALDSPNDSTCASNVRLPGGSGTPAQYRAMWPNVENRFKADGVTDVVWAILFEAFNPGNDNAFPNCLDQALYPGNQYIDWVGFDSYGTGAAYTGKTGSGAFQDSVGKTYQFMEQLSSRTGTSTAGMMNKPVVVGEFGSSGQCNAAPATSVDYYRDAKYALDNHLYPDIQMYMLFDGPGTGNSDPSACQLGYTNAGQPVAGDTVQNAFNAFATDPIFQSDTSVTPPPEDPTINTFTASPTAANVGDTSTLSWGASNATTCSVSPGGPQNTTATSSSWTTPAFTAAGTNSYTLSCKNSSGSANATATVTVTSSSTEPPVIDSFTSNPSKPVVGKTGTLDWSTANTTACSLNPNGPQSTTATSWTSPKYTSAGPITYTLSCKGANNTSVSKSTTVTVAPATTPIPLTLSITNPSNGSKLSNVVPISVNISDSSPIVSSKIVWDSTHVIRNATSQGAQGWGSRWNSTTAGNGNHTISVIVTDAAGNSVTKSVSVQVSNSSTCGGFHLFHICWF